MSDSTYAPPQAGPAVSPYAPPQANVETALPEDAAPERPAEITRAVTCLWIMFAIGVASTVWKLLGTPQLGPAYGKFSTIQQAMMYATILIIFAVSAWLYYLIGKGRNWARIVFLVLTAISLLWLPMAIRLILNPAFWRSPENMAFVINTALSAAACYFLLTKPARAWYREIKAWRQQQ